MSKTDFAIKRATRQGVKPLIGLFGESGTGKTYSALLLARGMMGPSGKIVMVDTESGRGSLYADVIPGGYDVLDLCEPFSPERYQKAMHAAAEAGAGIVVMDSMSHEWEGVGGVLDMAHQIEEKSGKPGLHCWKEPKLQHARMMLSLLQSPLPVICCLRAHYKSRQGKNERTGRTEIIKDEHTTPIQSESFIFEMTAHAEILQDHSIRLTKCSHPALRDCFPASGPIGIPHGEAIARWCAAPTLDGSTAKAPVDVTRARLVKALWTETAEIHGGGLDGKTKLADWLIAKSIMSDMETLDGMDAERLADVLDKTRVVLKEERGQ